MALELGGIPDKLGNRYERQWVVLQLLRLLDERLLSVCWEPASEHTDGIDVIVQTSSGIQQAQQCKVRNADREKWTFAALDARGILNAMRRHLDAGASHEFAIVSPIEGKLVQDICQSARDSEGNCESFFAYQIEAIGEDRRRAFRQFCRCLGLDTQQKADLAIAFEYLRRLHIIHWEDDLESQEHLKELARMLVAGDPGLVVTMLADFAQGNLRKTIKAADVHSFLVSRGLHPRHLTDDDRILPAIQRLQDQFEASIKPGLIADRLLPRTETQEVLKGLEEGGLVVLHGRAGIGKSGVLYELVTILKRDNHPYLPIRLDRQVPAKNPIQFGQDLGLPESPAQCLEAIAGTNLSVLILDQLDAIRWTAGHSFDGLEVCKSLVNEINSLRDLGRPAGVVLACRSFDLEHDPKIKAWLHDSAQLKLKKVEVKALKEEDVKQVCGQKYGALRKRQQDLLRLPAHLAMWVQLVASGEVPSFKTGPQLLQQFWNNRRQEVERAGIASVDIEFILGELVGYMERNACISAPLSTVESRARALDSLQSHGLLTMTARSVSFAHQSYLDYQIASRLLAQINSGHGSVRTWLGDKAEQSLFRREQLRQVLVLLEEESPRQFVASVRELLEDANVRFHLKHLVLELLSQLEDPSKALLDYLGELITRDEWRNHLIETVCVRHAPYVLWLLRQGVLVQWLEADTEKDRNTALWLLRSVADTIPDEVAETLEPFAERDEEWKERVVGSLAWSEEADSTRMFGLRLRLARAGAFKEWVTWGKLAKDHPDRAILLLGAVISTWDKDDLRPEQRRKRQHASGASSRFEQWTSDDLKALLASANTRPDLAWDTLVPQIQRLTMSDEENDDSLDMRHDWMGNIDRVGVAKGVLDMAIEAGKVLARQDGPDFFRRTELLRGDPSPVIQFLLVECYSAMPAQLTNESIEWLMDVPERLGLGPGEAESEWMPAARLIKSLSPHCSEPIFRRLEYHLIHYHSSNEKRLAEHYVKSWREGYFGDFWGRAQHFLLPALDERRRSAEVAGLIGVLRRRYAGCPSWWFLHRSPSRAGFVGSTLRQEKLSQISDRAWLEDIVGNASIPEEDAPSRYEAENKRWRKSSVWHFARDLATAAKRFPTRFAKLALRLPEGVHPRYVAAILEGLQQTKPPDGSEEEKAEWSPASVELTEAAIARLLLGDDLAVAGEFCSLLRVRSEEDWSEPVLQRLIRYAKEHPDPADGKLVMGVAGGDFDTNKASAHDLLNNALNVVRGKAAFAVGALLWAHPDWVGRLEPAIKSLVVDRHPAVRIAAVEACLPILNIDRDKAVRWFVQACQSDPRVTACRAGVYFFNCCMESHRDLLAPLIKAMVVSPLPDVAQEGAEEVMARWLLHGDFQDELDTCMAGTIPHRKGIAQVAAHFVLEPECTDRCRHILEMLMDDPDPTVRSETGHAFRSKAIFSIPNGQEITGKYIQSRAYHDHPASLFIAMEEYSGPLLPYGELILGICREFAGPLRDPSRDMSTGIAGDAYRLPPLLLRLYEQARERDDKAAISSCLDAWDTLFEKRVGVVQELAQSMEQ